MHHPIAVVVAVAADAAMDAAPAGDYIGEGPVSPHLSDWQLQTEAFPTLPYVQVLTVQVLTVPLFRPLVAPPEFAGDFQSLTPTSPTVNDVDHPDLSVA